MISVGMKYNVLNHIRMIPLIYQNGPKRLSLLSGQMLEILLIQGELDKIFKEKVFIFLEIILCFLISATLLLYLISIHIINLEIILYGKLQWMKSSTSLRKNAT